MNQTELWPISCEVWSVRILPSSLGLSLLGMMSSSAAFLIDFRDGTWDHSAVGGPASSTGWAKPTSTTQGYTSGVTEIETGVFLTVTTQFLGTANPGTNNFRLDPVNTPGFAFQNRNTGDRNSEVEVGGVMQTQLLNYQRIDFRFSEKVTLDLLRVGDIDTATSSGSQVFRDTVALELWQGAAPTTPGTGIEPTITLAPASRLSLGETTEGMNFAYATTLGNTETSNNPILAENTSAATFEYDRTGVDGFSVYLWNRGQATGIGNHAVVLQAEGSQITVVPEPTTTVCLLGSALAFGFVRRRA